MIAAEGTQKQISGFGESDGSERLRSLLHILYLSILLYGLQLISPQPLLVKLSLSLKFQPAGWEAKQPEYTPFLHLGIKPDGQVWLQHDGTDLKIALLLIERGVVQKDIVLAFQDPYRQQLMATMVWR